MKAVLKHSTCGLRSDWSRSLTPNRPEPATERTSWLPFLANGAKRARSKQCRGTGILR